MPAINTIKLRRGTALQWTTANPTLAEGEMGLETDTGKFKVGNGSSSWTALSYSSGIQGTTGPQGVQGIQGLIGVQGPQGTQGIQGLFGTQGTQGIQGNQGVQGTQGIQGSGTQGIQGTDGAVAAQGTQGIQGVQGTKALTVTSINAQGTSYTITTADQENLITLSGGGVGLYGYVSIPTNADMPVPTGYVVHLASLSNSTITIQAVNSGVTTLQSTGSVPTTPRFRALYSGADAIKTGTDSWLILGDIY